MRYRDVAAIVREADRAERRGTLGWARVIRDGGVTVDDYTWYEVIRLSRHAALWGVAVLAAKAVASLAAAAVP